MCGFMLALFVGVLGLQCNLGVKCQAEKLCLSWKKFVCRRSSPACLDPAALYSVFLFLFKSHSRETVF